MTLALRGTRLPSIRARLLLLLMLPSLCGAALVAGILLFEYRLGVERSSQATLITARALAEAVDNQLKEVQAGLTGLAASSTLKSGELAQFHERATEYVAMSGEVGNLVLADATGQQLVNTLRRFGEPLPNAGPQAPARIIIESGQPFARIVSAGLTGQPIVVVGVPVGKPGAVRYSLAASVPYEVFQELLARQQLPAGWIAAVVDDRGAIVARTVDPLAFRAKPVSQALGQALAREREGSFEGNTLEGIAVFTSFSRSQTTGWSVAVGIPQDALASDLRRSLLLVALLVLAILGIALGLAWVNGRRIAHALDRLVEVSVQLGRGEQVEAPSLPYAEVHQLGQAMAHAGATLQEARRDVEDNQARLRAVLESAMDGIVVADEQQRIVEFNAAACRLFGYEREEVLGRPLSILLPERFREAHDAAVARFAVQHEQPRTMARGGPPLYALRRDGSEFPIEASISAAKVGDGVVLTGIVRDITRRLAVQEALLRSNEELQHYASVASHDLRSPLRSVKGFLAVLGKTSAGRLDEKGRDLIARCVRAVDHMDRLTADLLSYARLQRGSEPFADVDLNAVVDEAKTLLAAPIAQSGAVIDVGALPVVRGAAGELIRLFENLLSNAIKYRGAQPPRIRIDAARTARGWLVSVTDNGIGIEPEFRERVFGLFERIPSQRPADGTGIGLAICRKVVQRHGGKIWVDPVPGGGSSLRFTLAAHGALDD